MHEQSTVQAIIEVLKDKNLRKAKIRLGMMRGEKNSILEIFRAYTEGTELEKTELEIEQVPVTSGCSCGFSGNVTVPGHVHLIRCPVCSTIIEPVTGNELEIITED